MGGPDMVQFTYIYSVLDLVCFGVLVIHDILRLVRSKFLSVTIKYHYF